MLELVRGWSRDRSIPSGMASRSLMAWPRSTTTTASFYGVDPSPSFIQEILQGAENSIYFAFLA